MEKEEPKICHYCQEELKKSELTKDHIFPKSKIKKLVAKGEELPESVDLNENRVIACAACNTNKGSKDYDSFIMLGVKAIRHLKKTLANRQQNKKKNQYRRKRKFRLK